MSFIPDRFKKIGVVQITAALSILGTLKYIQVQHEAATQAAYDEMVVRRTEARRADKEAAEWAAQQEEARLQREANKKKKDAGA